ncbi:MAG: hypothetical protein OEV00_02405 [Acidobacteriota bacterium]|nr:hypothetical protein [Acidobacteriota bacterium]MDH3784161.1 hypothetical protein [Acidobacteriota bacterium]
MRNKWLIVLAVFLSLPAFAAKITVVNLNGPGEGFNDATMVTGVHGNDGTTLGAQRLNAFQAAANYWGSRLASDVEIKIDAILEPLPCDPNSAVLGSAGANSISLNFPNAPVADTWYPAALASALAGFDVSMSSDLSASFNSDIDDDDPNCLTGIGWYYGIAVEAPGGTTSFYDTVLHEIGHGLGFATLVDFATGEEFGDPMFGFFPDIFESFLEDHSLGSLWPSLSNAQRVTSAVSTGELHWVGPSVANVCQTVQAGTSGTHVDMYAPNPLEGGSSVNHFDEGMDPNELMEPVATTTFQDHLVRAAMEDMGWRGVVLQTRSAGDVDNDGTEDVAVLAGDFEKAFNLVFVFSGDDGSEISKIFFPTAFAAKGMEILPSFGGTVANEVAVLMHNPVTGENLVRVKDLSSGANLSLITYSDSLYVVEMEIVPNFGGSAASEIALLVRERGGLNLNRVMIKDGSSGALLQTIYFHNTFISFDIEVVSDFGGTAAAEIAILSRRCIDQVVRVDTRDASSAALLSRIFFPTDQVPLDLEVLPDIGGVTGTTADELVVLGRRPTDNFVKIKVKDASNGVILTDINYSSTVEPLDIEIMADFAGTSSAEIALLGRKPSNGFVDVKIKDGTSAVLLEQLVFADTRLPYDLGILSDMDGGGNDEVSVMTLRPSDSQRRLPIKDAMGTLLWSIEVP